MKICPLFCLLTSSLVCAGEPAITGVVVDQSSRPVAGATVVCAAFRSTTNAAGVFTFDGLERCSATVTSTGFEAAHPDLRAGGENRVELAVAAMSETVLVTATRAPVSLEESGVSATIFTRQDLDARNGLPLAQVLRDVPGMNIAESGRRGAITSMFTRGGASTGTLVLLDGVPINEPGGQLDFAHLTTAGIDRIEAIRGPESTLFGAEAAAGVVQMFSAAGDPETVWPRGRFSYERGNLQTDHWTANLNGGVAGRIDYSLTADQFHTAGMFANDFYRNTNGTANLGFRIARNTTLRGIYRQFATVGGSPNQVAYGILDRDAQSENRDSTLLARLDDVRGAHYAQRASFGYHRLHFRSSDDLIDGPYNVAALLRSVPGTGVYLDRLVSPDLPPLQVPAGTTFVKRSVTLYPYASSSSADRASADYQGTYTHTGGTLVFGYEYERQQGFISGQTATRSNNGGYIHEQFRWGKRVFFTGGVRLEHSSTFGRKFAPRGSVTLALAGEHGPLTSTFLRFSAGRGITEPSLLQNFAQEGFYVGNPLLRPEKTTSYDLGIVQEVFSRRLRLEATAFRNGFEDLIVFDFGISPASWRNVDRSWGRGLEFVATLRPMRHVQISTNWTRLYTRITRTDSFSAYAGVGQPLLRRPKNSGSAWISVTPRRWTLIAGGRWTGDRQDSDFLFGLTRNPGNGTLYFSGSYQLSRHLAPYVRLDNALDARYEEVLGYTSLRRNGVAGLRVTW